MTPPRMELDEQFAGGDLDHDVWFPYYLPHWSSRAASRATYQVRDGELSLTIPPDQPLWCPGLHETPLRVSCLQTGSFAGPLGSSIGQQPFRDGLLVTEEQPTIWGYTPQYGRIEITMRGIVTERSMFAFWLSGIEDSPERSGEICVAEIFGEATRPGFAEVGMGLHRFRDPALKEEWGVEAMSIEASEFHTYGVDWRPGACAFVVDGQIVRRIDQAPDYPMQLMIAVYDFPDRAPEGAPESVPELVVSHVLGQQLVS